MAEKKPPTRAEQILGVLLIGGAVIWMGKCTLGDTKPTTAPCKTELDCKIQANTKRVQEACVRAASGQRHIEDRQFDLARGLRTGSMSASDARQAAAVLAATQQYTSQAQAECESARAEAERLGKQALVAYRESETAKASSEGSPVVSPKTEPNTPPKAAVKAKPKAKAKVPAKVAASD
jgi:hypothetical protein